MRSPVRSIRFCLAAFAVSVLGLPSTASAAVTLCVRFTGPSLTNIEGYRRLLIDEIHHHKTHKVVERNCESVLFMEYIKLDTTGYLTGRIGNGIPHRVKVKSKARIPAGIREVVTILLKNEPVYLVKNLETSGLLKRRPQSLLKHGHNFYGVEFFHMWMWAGKSFPALPGAAFRFRRTVDRWFVGARASFAYRPARIPEFPDGYAVKFFGSGKIEVGVNFFRDSFATLYLSGLMGVEFLQVYGTVNSVRDSLTTALASASLRVGVEILRYYSIRVDMFGMINLPLHKTKDIDTRVIDTYTPSAMVGCGVAF